MCVILRQCYRFSQKIGMHDTPSGIRVNNGNIVNIATPGGKAVMPVICTEGNRLFSSTGSHSNQVTAATPSDSDKGVAPEAMGSIWL